jgi:alkylation response protein AidB-like acyl-CoA dehydrogenase
VILPSEGFCRTQRQRESLHLAEALAAAFAPRAAEHDREATFPWENLAELRRAGMPGLTVPTEAGGGGAGVLETALVLEALARGDGSTALTLGWHLSNIGRMAETGGWTPAQREAVFRAAVTDGALINAALSEVATGSPSRGGRPTTRARPVPGGWRLDGHKVYVTGAPALQFFIVTATLCDDGGAAAAGGAMAHFLATRDTPGLRVEPAWDALGMRASRSDDVVLDDARLPAEARVDPRPKPGHSTGVGWGSPRRPATSPSSTRPPGGPATSAAPSPNCPWSRSAWPAWTWR